ncbi:Protein farnesyltransferase subunit beta [Zancudomyces culisetae]|uniref:Protein farnesyltransferase subunit beta n=1 Tax=Zancudomyces culisetae TaxID=1213189 RepID=A0A1R1PHX8_ZANCU|nr:Protein farnesyltransferase subunit beta [Zancudomyces culisetae]|eukprot:OMH80584.1 Protein farnesyltransferase subunit beta [Zancudomyces culisetae]
MKKLQKEQGGFGGGFDQKPHLATTYAAVCTLALVGTKEAYAVVDREKIYKWMMSMKLPSGGFYMCEGGEVDLR